MASLSGAVLNPVLCRLGLAGSMTVVSSYYYVSAHSYVLLEAGSKSGTAITTIHNYL